MRTPTWQRLVACPTWCTGHRSIEDDFCLAEPSPFVELGNGDFVQLHLVQDAAPVVVPRIAIYFGDQPARGSKLTISEASTLASEIVILAAMAGSEWKRQKQ